MIPLIESRRRDIQTLCQRFKVKHLNLFGSAAEETFDAQRSDLDFLVEFLPLQAGEHADVYFGLLHGLEDLFQRKIDLVTLRAIRNRYFLNAVQNQQQVIYVA